MAKAQRACWLWLKSTNEEAAQKTRRKYEGQDEERWVVVPSHQQDPQPLRRSNGRKRR
jgi:hypothetical protein